MQGRPDVEAFMKPVQDVIGKLPYGKPVPYDTITTIYNRAYSAVWSALDAGKK